MSEYYEFDSTVYVIIRPKDDNLGEDHDIDIDIDCRFLLHEAEKNAQTLSIVQAIFHPGLANTMSLAVREGATTRMCAQRSLPR